MFQLCHFVVVVICCSFGIACTGFCFLQFGVCVFHSVDYFVCFLPHIITYLYSICLPSPYPDRCWWALLFGSYCTLATLLPCVTIYSLIYSLMYIWLVKVIRLTVHWKILKLYSEPVNIFLFASWAFIVFISMCNVLHINWHARFQLSWC